MSRSGRRDFLRRLALLAGAGCCGTSGAIGQAASSELNREQLALDLKKLLVFDDPRLFNFAVETVATCVVGKIRAPSLPLQHAWLVPGGGYYAQWLWDTMFVADLLAILPGQAGALRGVFQNFWDFQDRWDEVNPPAQHGMVANFIAPYDGRPERDGKQWRTFPAYSQAPLLAWGMERVFRRTGDKRMLRAGLARLERFHEWYWRERDVTDVGMIGVGSYSGDVQHARYETYDREVDLDTLQLTNHPKRPTGVENGKWYGDVLIPANTAYLLASELSLARLADEVKDHDLAARRRARYARGKASMQQHSWSNEHGCFMAIRRDSLEQLRVPTVGGFMPLVADVPSPQQAAEMAKTLSSDAGRRRYLSQLSRERMQSSSLLSFGGEMSGRRLIIR